MVFHEIMPRALSLMTDVFGNYVIQKVVLEDSCYSDPELDDMRILINMLLITCSVFRAWKCITSKRTG